jgi:hypothetical protein
MHLGVGHHVGLAAFQALGEARRIFDTGANEVDSSLSLEDYFNEIEAQLESILLALGPELSPEESRQVSHFLDVGEYGLALQTLTDLLIEERKKISISTYNDIVGVANRMGMEREVALEALESRVHEGV